MGPIACITSWTSIAATTASVMTLQQVALSIILNPLSNKLFIYTVCGTSVAIGVGIAFLLKHLHAHYSDLKFY